MSLRVAKLKGTTLVEPKAMAVEAKDCTPISSSCTHTYVEYAESDSPS